MKWYYNKEDEVIGPVSEEELCNQINENSINRETLVWNEEMEDWGLITESSVFQKVFSEKKPPPLPTFKNKPKNKTELLPSVIECEFCENESILDSIERKQNKFLCHSCKRHIYSLDGELGKEFSRSSSKSIRQNEQEEFIESDNMKWYKFYTYALLPLGIIQGVLALFIYYNNIPSSGVPSPSISLFSIGVLLLLFIGLKRRKLWGWYMNLIYLGFVSFLSPLMMETNDLIVVTYIMSITFFYLNYEYFDKRKSLFN